MDSLALTLCLALLLHTAAVVVELLTELLAAQVVVAVTAGALVEQLHQVDKVTRVVLVTTVAEITSLAAVAEAQVLQEVMHHREQFLAMAEMV
jgi:hypothetical protein